MARSRSTPSSSASTKSQGYTYSGSNDIDAVAWYSDNSNGAVCDYYNGRGTWPVGQKAPNELGIHDMSGNVIEWCFDWHPSWVGSSRALRGGSWYDYANRCEVSCRFIFFPIYAYSFIGFRAVLPPDPADAP